MPWLREVGWGNFHIRHGGRNLQWVLKSRSCTENHVVDILGSHISNIVLIYHIKQVFKSIYDWGVIANLLIHWLDLGWERNRAFLGKTKFQKMGDKRCQQKSQLTLVCKLMPLPSCRGRQEHFFLATVMISVECHFHVGNSERLPWSSRSRSLEGSLSIFPWFSLMSFFLVRRKPWINPWKTYHGTLTKRTLEIMSFELR